MTDVYEEAVEKIAACEKASASKAEASIKIAEVVSSGKTFFLEGDYNEALSTINRMILKGADNVQSAMGDEIPIFDSKQEAAQQPKGGAGRRGKGIFGIRGGGAKAEAEKPKAQSSGNAPETEQQKAQPHVELGKMVGNTGSEINVAVFKAEETKHQTDSGRIARLSIPDQIAELEKISLGLYEKRGSAEEMDATREELKALSESVKTEKSVDESAFGKRLLELRNQRLREAMAMAGMRQNQ